MSGFFADLSAAVKDGVKEFSQTAIQEVQQSVKEGTQTVVEGAQSIGNLSRDATKSFGADESAATSEKGTPAVEQNETQTKLKPRSLKRKVPSKGRSTPGKTLENRQTRKGDENGSKPSLADNERGSESLGAAEKGPGQPSSPSASTSRSSIEELEK